MKVARVLGYDYEYWVRILIFRFFKIYTCGDVIDLSKYMVNIDCVLLIYDFHCLYVTYIVHIIIAKSLFWIYNMLFWYYMIFMLIFECCHIPIKSW